MTFELARQWVRHGHEVTVFTSDQRDSLQRFADLTSEIDGIKIRRFRNPSQTLAARWPFLFFYPRGMLDALCAAKDDFDVVHVAESRGQHNRWVARYLGPQGVPIVWSAYGGLAEGEGLRRLYRRMHDWCFNTRMTVRLSSALIAQTSHEAEVYRRLGAASGQIHPIPLAVNWDDFSSLPERGGFRRKLGIGDRERLIVFLGRIHHTKGLQVLIPAFAAASRRYPEARLAVVGWDHGYLAAVKKAVSDLGLGDRVLFPGPVYGAERFEVYVDSDVFALTPGVYEETSLAALEACACGAGCLITRQCEIPGLDTAGGGIIVDYTIDAVADGLKNALSGNVAREWGASARRMVQERFTTETVARLHEDVFAHVSTIRTQGRDRR